jgi:hypothetical protein
MENAGANSQTVTVNEVYNFMESQNILMSFLGELSHSTVTSILHTMKGVLNAQDADFLVKKRVYNVLVECLDNICRHNLNQDQLVPPAHSLNTIFTFSDRNDHFSIETGNLIGKNNIAALKKKIEEVNALNKEGLKELYRKRLEENPDGGGLGIVDISLKTGSDLSYEFREINSELSFFILRSTVKK